MHCHLFTKIIQEVLLFVLVSNVSLEYGRECGCTFCFKLECCACMFCGVNYFGIRATLL
jgi:hypothetical protein